MKKKIFIILALLFVTTKVFSQRSLSAYFDGYWSDWKQLGTAEIFHGNYDGFMLYLEKEGPWNYRFKFTVDNMTFPDKKQRKKDIKENKWYVFSGTVEYYITDNYLTILSLFRAAKGPMFAPAKLENGRPTKKITSKATIKVAPFKDLPRTYNIFFDNVGVGITLDGSYFPGVKYE